MTNPLVDKVESNLKQLGIHNAELLSQRYDRQCFGNAIAIYRLGNLHLKFVRDRGDDTVDFLNPADKDELYTFSDMSLVMKWVSLDDLLRKYKTFDFSEPPAGPIPLFDALELIVEHMQELQRMFSQSELDATLTQLKDSSRKRCKAFFG